MSDSSFIIREWRLRGEPLCWELVCGPSSIHGRFLDNLRVFDDTFCGLLLMEDSLIESSTFHGLPRIYSKEALGREMKMGGRERGRNVRPIDRCERRSRGKHRSF
jgi:hypothetical protein